MPHGSIDLVPIILIKLSRNKLKRDKGLPGFMETMKGLDPEATDIFSDKN